MKTDFLYAMFYSAFLGFTVLQSLSVASTFDDNEIVIRKVESAKTLLENLKGYKGLSVERLQKEFGKPDEIRICSVSFPTGNPTPDKMFDFYRQTPARILVYGKIGVFVSIKNDIVDVRSGSFKTFIPENFTRKKLKELIGTNESSLYKRFGPPQNVEEWFPFAAIKKLSDTQQIEQKPNRVLVYDKVCIWVNIYNKIIDASISTSEPTCENLNKFIGKTKMEIYKSFGSPDQLWDNDYGLPDNDEDEADFNASETAQTLVYSGICFDISIDGKGIRVYKEDEQTDSFDDSDSLWD